MSNVSILFQIIQLVIPMVLTLAILGVIIAMMIGSPYCHYVSLVADASTDKGKENLARYLAKKTGGRKIDADRSWRSFMPAARDLHRKHVTKRTAL